MKTILLLSLAITSTFAMANDRALAQKYQGLYELTSCKDSSTGEVSVQSERTTLQINVKLKSETKDQTTSESIGYHTVLDVVANTTFKVDNLASGSSNEYKSDFFSKDITTYTTKMNSKKLTYKEVTTEKDRFDISFSGPSVSTDNKNTVSISTDGKRLTQHTKYESKGEKTQEYICTYKRI